ncbi:MAG: DUF4493 domain-containing protein [Bacteroides sp.]|nr:DUF4493 domain-containing protein [Bacteroides sp.]MCM1379715.1 DUF4493 domain-containing protein [Bacteroides sp.]MCM1446070.1 DUF4493 domain-containing protein [Prevotella sp.]
MKFKYQAALAAIALALGSCAADAMFDDGTGTSGKTGINKPGVEVNNAEKVIKNAPSRAAYDVSNFLLDFYRDGEAEPFMSKKYGDLNATIDLPAGDYTIGVRSHDVKDAEWDNPYFVGTSEKFTIVSEKITTVEPISCKFSSIKVTVKFSDKLREQLGDNVKVTVLVGQGKLVYTTADENRGGYFAPLEGSTTMVVTFTGTVDGREETATRTYADIAAGQHRQITFNAGGELLTPDEPKGTMEVGGLSISYDYTDETLDGSVDPGKEEVINDGEAEPGQKPEIPDPDDPNKGDEPTPPGPGGDDTPDQPNEPINFGGTLTDGCNVSCTELLDKGGYTVTIAVPNKIEDVVVEIISDDGLTQDILEGVQLTNKFSLVNPGTPVLESKIQGLGFPIKDDVYDKAEMNIDLTPFMAQPLLSMLNGGNNSNTFVLNVTDQAGNKKTLTFTIYSRV